MTDDENQGSEKDPIVSWGSIPGAGAGTPDDDDVHTEAIGSAYEQVRGLLTEPGAPVGTGQFSEKMAEEMESFDHRWSQRPVSALVTAGKKMADSSDSIGLNRLLGLSKPAGTTVDPDSEASDEVLEVVPAEVDTDSVATDGDSRDGRIDVPDTEEPAAKAEISPEEEILHDAELPSPETELSKDQPSTITPTSRLAAAQTAYTALNPVEADIFRSQAGLLDADQVARAAARSQTLALETLSIYEREVDELQQQLETMRAEANSAAHDAATRHDSLATTVRTLTGQLELATAELVATRRADTDDGESEGGAGRQLIKGHDDLRAKDEETTHAQDRVDEIDDEADVEVDHRHPETEGEFDLLGEEISTAGSEEGGDDHEGGGSMLQALQRLAQGDDEPESEQGFGE